MSLGKKALTATARLWMNWPLWGGLLAILLLTRHFWVFFAPVEHAVPGTTIAAQSEHAGQLFGSINSATSPASLDGIRPIGIFASNKNGFAVLQTGGRQIGTGVGEQVVPGVRLVETHPDYVVLERNGVRQRVDLNQASIAAAQQPNGTSPSALSEQLRSKLSPEQRAILQQQETIRGRP